MARIHTREPAILVGEVSPAETTYSRSKNNKGCMLLTIQNLPIRTRIKTTISTNPSPPLG
jgi:hypothetical protein